MLFAFKRVAKCAVGLLGIRRRPARQESYLDASHWYPVATHVKCNMFMWLVLTLMLRGIARACPLPRRRSQGCSHCSTCCGPAGKVIVRVSVIVYCL